MTTSPSNPRRSTPEPREYRYVGRVTAYVADNGHMVVRWHTADGEHLHSDAWPADDFAVSFRPVDAIDEQGEQR